MSTRLPALMDVLDRADAAEALNRDQLLQAARDLGTHHSPAALATAVDAHLAETIPEVTPLAPTVGFKWHWPRPDSPGERDDRLAVSQRWAWADTEEGIARRTLRVQMASTMIGFLVGLGLAWEVVRMAHMEPALAALGSLVACAVGMGLGTTWADRQVKRAYKARQRYLPFTGDLAYKEWVYLDIPETRDYLRAVLTSPVPDLLRSDARLLNNLAHAALRKRREAEEQEAEELRARQRAAKEEAKKNRLGRFARALNGEPDALLDEPTEEVGLYD